MVMKGVLRSTSALKESGFMATHQKMVIATCINIDTIAKQQDFGYIADF
jgi:hypothetical protein